MCFLTQEPLHQPSPAHNLTLDDVYRSFDSHCTKTVERCLVNGLAFRSVNENIAK